SGNAISMIRGRVGLLSLEMFGLISNHTDKVHTIIVLLLLCRNEQNIRVLIERLIVELLRNNLSI
ncbi:MAG TPA: hypothetical protein DCM38_07335, partial [Gammaproteobacteria bacterium]|nr:hypothetical protein [Gammaproteobacteria bacterium]